MPTRRKDAINIKTTYDNKGVENAKKGIESLNKATKDVNQTQKQSRVIANQSINAIKKASESSTKSVEKVSKALIDSRKRMDTFRKTPIGRVVKGFVGLVESIAKFISYLSVAGIAINLLTKVATGGFKTISGSMIKAGKASGSLIGSLGQILGVSIDLISRFTSFGAAIKSVVFLGQKLTNIPGVLKDVGFTINKVSATAASFKNIIKSAFQRDPITKTLNIFRNLGDVIKNVGDVTIKAGTKLNAFGGAGTIAGAVVSKIGLAIKSFSQLVSKGIKVKSWQDFVNLLKSAGDKFLRLGTFKQILKQIQDIPFLGQWLESFTQIGKYLNRLQNSFVRLGKTPFARALGKTFESLKSQLTSTFAKVGEEISKATTPMEKLKSGTTAFVNIAKQGFSNVKNNIGSFVDVLKSGATAGISKVTGMMNNLTSLFKSGFDTAKNKAQELGSFITSSGYMGLSAFLRTVNKAGEVTPAVLAKATLKAEIYASAQSAMNRGAEKFAANFQKIRDKSRVIDTVAGAVGKVTKGFRDGIKSVVGFVRGVSLIKQSVGAIKSFLGIQQKVPKTFTEIRQGMLATFRYGVFMFRTLSRWVGDFVNNTLGIAATMEQTERKFNVVFGNMSKAYLDWTNSFARATNFNRNELVKWAATFQDTFVPLGFARDRGAELSQTLLEVSAHVARFNNLPTEQTMNAFSSAIVGAHQTVKQFGIIINDATLNTELMNMGIEGGTSAASEQEKVLARLNIILNSTKDAYGAAYDNAKTFPALIEGITSRAQDMGRNIGKSMETMASTVLDTVVEMLDNMSDKILESSEDMEELFTNIGNAASEVVEAFFEMLEGIDLTVFAETIEAVLLVLAQVLRVIGDIVAMTMPFINFVLGKVNSILKAIGGLDKNLLLIISRIVTLGVVLLATAKVLTFLGGVYVNMKKIWTILKALKTAQLAFNATAATNPYILIAAGLVVVTGLVVGLGVALSDVKKETKGVSDETDILIEKEKTLAALQKQRNEISRVSVLTKKEITDELEYQYGLINKQIALETAKDKAENQRIYNFLIYYKKLVESGQRTEENLQKVKEYEAAWERVLSTTRNSLDAVGQFPQTAEEALRIYEDENNIVVLLLKRWEEILVAQKEIAKVRKDSLETVLAEYGHMNELIDKTINKNRELIDLGRVYKYMQIYINKGMADREQSMLRILEYGLRDLKQEEALLQLEEARVGIDSQLYFVKRQLEQLTGLALNTEEDYLKVSEYITDENKTYIEQLLKEKSELQAQQVELGITIKQWENIVGLIYTATESVSEYTKRVTEGIEAQKKAFQDALISADITRQIAEPEWEKILAISDLEQKKAVLEGLVSKLTLDFFQLQEAAVINPVGLAYVENFLKKVQDELDIVNDKIENMIDPKEIEDRISEIKRKTFELTFNIEVADLQDQIQEIKDQINFAISQGLVDEAEVLKEELKSLEDEFARAVSLMDPYNQLMEKTIQRMKENIPYLEEIKAGFGAFALITAPFVKSWKKTYKTIKESNIGQAIAGVIENLKDRGQRLWKNTLGGMFRKLRESWESHVEQSNTVIAKIIKGIGAGFEGTVGAMFRSVGAGMMIFGSTISMVVQWIWSLVQQVEIFSQALSFITQKLIEIVTPIAQALLGVIGILLQPLFAFVMMIAKFVTPVMQGLGLLVERLQPLFLAIGEYIAGILNVIAPLIPFIFQIIELIGNILTPVIKTLAAPMHALGQILEALNPLFQILMNIIKAIATPIIFVLSLFEWLGNIIKNLGKFISNVIDRPLRPGTWKEGIEKKSFLDIVKENMENLWKDPETYDSFKPEQLDFENLMDSTNMEDFMTGWQAGMDAELFDQRTQISQAVVTKPPDVYNTIKIEGVSIVEGLNDLRIVTLQDIIDAMNSQADYERGLTVLK